MQCSKFSRRYHAACNELSATILKTIEDINLWHCGACKTCEVRGCVLPISFDVCCCMRCWCVVVGVAGALLVRCWCVAVCVVVVGALLVRWCWLLLVVVVVHTRTHAHTHTHTAQVCDDGSEENDRFMLFCDICDRGFHTYCLRPPLESPPEGEWGCPICQAQHRRRRGTAADDASGAQS